MHLTLFGPLFSTCSDAIDLFTLLSLNECTGEAGEAAWRIKGGHTHLKTNVSNPGNMHLAALYTLCPDKMLSHDAPMIPVLPNPPSSWHQPDTYRIETCFGLNFQDYSTIKTALVPLSKILACLRQFSRCYRNKKVTNVSFTMEISWQNSI